MKKTSIILCCIVTLTLLSGCNDDNIKVKVGNVKVDDNVEIKVNDNIEVDVGNIKKSDIRGK